MRATNLLTRVHASTMGIPSPPGRANRKLAGPMFGIIYLVVTVLRCGLASAQEEDTPMLILGASATYDTNLFRTSGISVDTQSDTSSTAYLGLRLDKVISQQHLLIDVTGTAYRYDKFSYLDSDGFDYSATWLWSLTSRFTGSLRGSRNEAQVSFADTLNAGGSTRTSDNYRFDVDGWVYGGWHTTLAGSQSKTRTEGTSPQPQPDYQQSSAEIGIRYVSGSANSVSVVRRRLRGEQENVTLDNDLVATSDDYLEDNNELNLSWNPTQKSGLSGQLVYINRQYNMAPQRNFSGYTGSASYNWRPTDRLSLNLSTNRKIEAWQSISSNYRVSNQFLIFPTWQLTTKTRIEFRLQRTYEEFPVQAATVGTTERSDVSDVVLLGLSWSATRSIAVNTSLSRETRDSNDPLVEYKATVANASVSASF